MLQFGSVDLDREIFHHDYTAAYRPYLRGELELYDNGRQFRALCPFHDESDPSFYVTIATGVYHCFGCNAGGNFIEFYAKMHKCETGEAYARILEEHGFKSEPGKPIEKIKTNGLGLASLTTPEYSNNKHLPQVWLERECYISTGQDRDRIFYVRIPYLDEHGVLLAVRRRYSILGTNKKHPFSWDKGSHAQLYGLWLLPKFRKADDKKLILVEGESDAQTLWWLGYQVLGVPGAGLFQGEWVKYLNGFDIYLHQENDDAGGKFINNVLSRCGAEGFTGRTFVFKCSDIDGLKDPSAVWIKRGDEAKNLIGALIDGANEVDFKLPPPENKIDGLDIILRQPENYQVDRDGVWSVSPKDGALTLISKTPIFLTKRLKNIVTREVKSEIAFFDKTGLQREIMIRSELFQSRTITNLADRGCSIGSENARPMAKFLLDQEASNLDIIPQINCTSQLGWQFLPGGRRCFVPYGDGPAGSPSVVLDCDPNTRRTFEAFSKKGSLADWCKYIAPLREKSDVFRLLLAASAAAPFLRIVGQRSFTVYLWGESGIGKTAALKLALSFWGKPDGLMKSFNTTKVGLEMMAAMSRDLPLGIDERQLASKKDALGDAIYMIAEGLGKLRGAKNGGVRALAEWLTILLACGEEPITSDCSMPGIKNRIVEIKGVPFADKNEARRAYEQVGENYGVAGDAFINILLNTPTAWLRKAYKLMEHAILDQLGPDANGQQVSYVALLALVDALLSLWFFKSDRTPENSASLAKSMMADHLRIMRGCSSILVKPDGSYSIVAGSQAEYDNRQREVEARHFNDPLYLLGFRYEKGDPAPEWKRAIDMAVSILQVAASQSGESYGEAGVHAIADFYYKEHAHFEHDEIPPKVISYNGGQDATVFEPPEPPVIYGWSAEDRNGELYVCFYKTFFDEFLVKHDLNPKKILTYAAENNFIATSFNGKRVCETVIAKHKGAVVRVVKFFISRIW